MSSPQKHVRSIALCLLLACAAAARAGDAADLAKAPEAVRDAAKKLAGEHAVERFEQITQDGGTVYEIGYKVGTAVYGARIAPSGEVVGHEVEIDTSAVPRAVLDAGKRQYPKARLTEAAIVTTGGRMFYELAGKSGADAFELRLNADGSAVPEAAEKPRAAGKAEKEWLKPPVPEASALAATGRNPYFILEPGYRLLLRKKGGEDTLTITVLDETKKVDGVETRVVEERETEAGELAEVSRNYFAVGKETHDLYYFGEDVDTYKRGKLAGHGGSWLAGVGGAKAGLMLPGKPVVGMRFYQEQAPGVAEDRSEIVGTTEQVSTPAGDFKDCLKVTDDSAIEKGEPETKTYAPGVGLLADEDFRLVEYGRVKGK